MRERPLSSRTTWNFCGPSLGVTPDQIQNALGTAFGGQQVSQIYASADQYQVILELLPQYQKDASALSRVYLTGTAGAMVPVSAVTTISRSTMPQSINHAGQIPAVTVSFDLAPGKALSDAVVYNRRARDLSQRLYQAGTAEFLTVLDAERSLLGTETALAQSRQAISSDLVNIYRALGGGWEEKK